MGSMDEHHYTFKTQLPNTALHWQEYLESMNLITKSKIPFLGTFAKNYMFVHVDTQASLFYF